MLRPEHAKPVPLARPASVVIEAGRQVRAPGCVPLLHAVQLAGLLRPLEPELPDLAEHAISRVAAGGFVGDEDRLVDECAHEVENLAGRQVVGTTDRGRGGQVVAADEHRRPRPEPLFELGTQLEGPVDARPQRLVPLVGVAVAEVEHLYALGEAVANLLGRQRPDSGGRQLDGQRHAVQVTAQTHDGRGICRCQPEVGASRGGPVHEEVDGLVVGDGLRCGHGRLVREGERRHDDDVLAAQAEQPPAGEQEPEVRAGGAETLHQVADRGHEVLAVVEHQKRSAVSDVIGKGLELPRPVTAVQADCLGHGRAQQLGLGEVGEWRHPASVAVAAPVQLGDAEGEPSLANSAWPDERDHPGRRQVLSNVGQQQPATHERGVEGGLLDGSA